MAGQDERQVGDPALKPRTVERRLANVARALAQKHIRTVRRWDTTPEELEKILPGGVEYCWRDFIDMARVAIAAADASTSGEGQTYETDEAGNRGYIIP